MLPLEEQLPLLTRGITDLHGDGELEKRLAAKLKDGKVLRVKAGFDPTVPDLHLGHTVLMSKMAQFQKLGHHVTFLIGDFTACIGDPTGRNELRPQLTKEQVMVAAETYATQAFKVLDKSKTEIRYNGEWFDKMTAQDMIKLSAKYTVARMLERDDFHKRYTSGRPISVHEFLYPLAQGYDSVALNCDIELGGQDQLFNLLVGRDLMRDHALIPQMVMTTPLLIGTDGHLENGQLVGDKMSKSKGNYIGIEDAPKDMYGKAMSIADALMWNWYDLLSAKTPSEIAQLKSDVEGGRAHPKTAKVGLAHEIVTRFHSKEAADNARDEFERVFASKGVPDEMPEVTVDNGVSLVDGIAAAPGMFASKAEIRRLIGQGGATRNGEKLVDPTLKLDKGEHVLRLGKHKFLKLIVR